MALKKETEDETDYDVNAAHGDVDHGTRNDVGHGVGGDANQEIPLPTAAEVLGTDDCFEGVRRVFTGRLFFRGLKPS